MTPACNEYSSLAASVDGILQQIASKTALLLELFRSKQSEKFARMDKELELLVGEKERTVGALRQHAKEHKCQPTV